MRNDGRGDKKEQTRGEKEHRAAEAKPRGITAVYNALMIMMEAVIMEGVEHDLCIPAF